MVDAASTICLALNVGAALLSILMGSCKIKLPGPDGEPIEVPAFFHDHIFHNQRNYGVVSWHNAFYQCMDDEAGGY